MITFLQDLLKKSIGCVLFLCRLKAVLESQTRDNSWLYIGEI